jgi:hypothetical protein
VPNERPFLSLLIELSRLNGSICILIFEIMCANCSTVNVAAFALPHTDMFSGQPDVIPKQQIVCLTNLA